MSWGSAKEHLFLPGTEGADLCNRLVSPGCLDIASHKWVFLVLMVASFRTAGASRNLGAVSSLSCGVEVLLLPSRPEAPSSASTHGRRSPCSGGDILRGSNLLVQVPAFCPARHSP